MPQFSTGDVIFIFIYLALLFVIPVLFILPFILRARRVEGDNTELISFIFIEIPIAIVAALHTLYFHEYFDHEYQFIFNLVPYTLILWFLYFMRNESHRNLRKILCIGWCSLIAVFSLHTWFLLPTKKMVDHDSAVNIALREGDGVALDVLWKTCPEDIDSLLFRMKFEHYNGNNFDYPITSFEKVIQCSKYKNDFTSNYAINNSFASSTSINFLLFLYSKIDDNKKKEIQNDKTIINNRLDDLRQCSDDKCSTIKIQMLDFLLKLVPEWQSELPITPVDLHNAIIDSNKTSISYFSKFVKTEDKNDIIAMDVVFGDNQAVISKIKDRTHLPTVIGREFGDSGDNITLVKFIIMNGTEEMIDFIINNLNYDVMCYASAPTINYNTVVSSDYNFKYNQRFKNKTCADPGNL